MANEVKMHKVMSSSISFVGYDEGKRELTVIFTSGKKYIYSDIPKHVYEGIFFSQSTGKYFRQAIVNRKYKYRQAPLS